MRVRAGLTAVAVASMALLGCGGDDGGGDGADRSSGAEDTKAEERTSAELHLEKVATLHVKIEDPVLTDAGIVAVRGDRLVLISADDGSVLRGGEGFSSATADDPSIGHVVQLDDGKVFARTGVQGVCGWALVEPASLALGAPIATSDTSCGFSDPKVAGRSVLWIRTDAQVTPIVDHLESADLEAGTRKSVPLDDALPAGYTRARVLGASLLRTPEGSVGIALEKDGDPSSTYLATVEPDLSMSEPQPLGSKVGAWMMGQAIGLPRVPTRSAVWYVTTDLSGEVSAARTLTLVLANRAGDDVARLEVPELSRTGAEVFDLSDMAIAAGDDTAFLLDVRQAGGSSSTTIYRVDVS
jgi:hypothetical protein